MMYDGMVPHQHESDLFLNAIVFISAFVKVIFFATLEWHMAKHYVNKNMPFVSASSVYVIHFQ